MSWPVAKKKVLLMGKSGSGKTSMRSIIFANYSAKDTMRLGPTLDVEHSHVRFLGDMVLNLWDCGGQEGFYEMYLAERRDFIFRNVEVLIYVFDVESKDLAHDMKHYQDVLSAIYENASDARVFVLIHKMDTIKDEQEAELRFQQRVNAISAANEVQGIMATFYKTSIWDETLYKAWSAIVYSLIPNISLLESNLKTFCGICGADEVVLFEKATFLVISHVTEIEHNDIHRFEKISNIIKQFKLSISKTGCNLSAMMVKNSNFTSFISDFTHNTSIMVITSSPDVHQATTELNINAARKPFEALIHNKPRQNDFPGFD